LGIKAISEDGHLLENEFTYLSEEDYALWTKRVTPQENDIVFSYEATLGRYAMIPKGFYGCLGRRLAVLRAKNEDINMQWLYYYFYSQEWETFIRNRTINGSTVDRISIDDFPTYVVNLPERKTQDYIVSVLFSIDRQIQLNNAINSELEKVAKTLYDYWFVQFDFPNAEGKPYRANGGEMVYNEVLKREIPKGWEVMSLGETLDITRGDIITEKETEPGDIKVVAAGVTFSYLHSTPNRPPNTITISASGANAGYINFWQEEIYASDCITVRGNEDIDTLLAYQYLKNMQSVVFNKSTGSAQPHVYPHDIKDLRTCVIPRDLKKNISPILLNINKQLAVKRQESEELVVLRDFLLPLLINGQVAVAPKSR
jgi:type I restriction enzyme S subunit